MIFLTSIYRIIKAAFTSLWRNFSLSVASALIMVLTLFTISFMGSFIYIVDKSMTILKDKVDISVYFKEETSKDQIFALQNLLMAKPEVKSVDYISKEVALVRWRERLKDNTNVRDVITEADNPLPRSLEIKTDETQDLEKINTFLLTDDYKPLIKEISYQKNKTIIDRLVRITAFVKLIGWVLSGIFVLISLLVVYNTIALAIWARSNEIEIMKLVGASDWYVTGPFLVEGFAYGLVGSVVSAVILFLAFKFSFAPIQNYLGLSSGDLFLSDFSYGLVVAAQLLTGLLIGVVCSAFAVKRHLKY